MDCTVILPAYRPPEQMAEFIRALVSAGFSDILLVDDGSGEDYAALFEQAEKDGVTLLRHEKNRGKGEALKTAFRACIERGTPPKAVITADCDGQHQIDDILNLFYTIRTASKTVLLGVRGFEGAVPLRSRLGNSAASMLMKKLYHFPFDDTQTGLRAFSGDLLERLAEISGTRYEYETRVLITAAREHIAVKALRAQTVYAPKNGTSRYRPVRDSLRVTAAMVAGLRRKE